MHISIIGSGYVGSVTGACFSKHGHNILLCDINQAKVDTLNKGESPIYEPGLAELLKRGLGNGTLSATTEIKDAVKNSDAVFICVGTPSREDGSTELNYVQAVAKTIGEAVKEKDGYLLIVVKSTVPPKTTDIVSKIVEEVSGRGEGDGFGTAMNPEFLKEGSAIEDFEVPDRIVLGVRNEKGEKIMREIYGDFSCPFLICEPSTAEMIKYASNSMLATRISFSNEIANACKVLGLDTYKVMKGMGLDSRIGLKFLNPGIGFGGSCFPKDVSSLTHTIKEAGIEPILLNSVLKVNKEQPERFVQVVEKTLGKLPGKAAVLGLSFKPDTDDIRESPALAIAKKLAEKGVKLTVYDPKAMENSKAVLGESVQYAENAKDAVADSEVVFVLTDWKEFKNKELYEGKRVFEGRKLFQNENLDNFEGVCW